MYAFAIIVQQVEGLSGGEEGGTYFVDQSGQYYYQANSDETPVMTQVQIQEVEESDVHQEGEVTQEEQYHEIEELENVDGDEDVRNLLYFYFHIYFISIYIFFFFLSISLGSSIK